MRVGGAILTGGTSSRFGSDKALASVGNQLLGQRVLEALRGAAVDPIVALGGTAGGSLGLVTIADTDPGGGPLPALAGALAWFGRSHVLVVPCDLVLLDRSHVLALREALDSIAEHDGEDVALRTAVVASTGGRAQPSLGIWPASWSGGARRAVSSGSRAFRDALELGPWKSVPLPDEALSDADTPEALAALMLLLGVDRAETEK